MAWWQSFFDEDYFHLWTTSPERDQSEAEGIWKLLALSPGSRVLDAPCGYGRLSRLLAERGAEVVGVDQSETLLAQARGDVRYLRHDLRQPLAESGFDAAINIYSSLGYGESEDDDVAILRTLREALRPGGKLLIETNHRDALMQFLAFKRTPAARLPDGTLVIEEPRFDPLTGRVDTCWYWWGPRGSGKKPASLRVYSATELIRLIQRAGLRFSAAHEGFCDKPFTDPSARLVLVAERP